MLIVMSFGSLELGSIAYAHAKGDPNVFDWTLSDTIRRWSLLYRIVAPATCGAVAFLLYHFFLQTN